MRRINWGPVALIVCFLIAFFGYRLYDKLNTDTEAPSIIINDAQMLEVSVQDPKDAMLQGVSATDAQDGDVSAKLVVESIHLLDASGMLEVNYAVADAAGNVAKASRNVMYTDYDSPKFTLDRPLISEEHDNFDIMNVVRAWDVLDGDIQHRIRATALTDGPISNLGTHYVYFQVTNSLGDMAELELPVEVLEPDSYSAELTLTDYLIYIPVGTAFDPYDYLDCFTHRSEEFLLNNGLPRNFSVKINGDVRTNEPGVYAVEYKVTYNVRHQSNSDYDQKFTGYSKLIVVVEG